MRPLTTEQLSKITLNGTLTGSRAYGGSTPESDWDMILTKDDFDRFEIEEDQFSDVEGPWTVNEDHRSYYCMTEQNEKFNLLVFKSKFTYEIWVSATSLLASMNREIPAIATAMTNKRLRVDLFRALRFAALTDDSALTEKINCFDDYAKVVKEVI